MGNFLRNAGEKERKGEQACVKEEKALDKGEPFIFSKGWRDGLNEDGKRGA